MLKRPQLLAVSDTSPSRRRLTSTYRGVTLGDGGTSNGDGMTSNVNGVTSNDDGMTSNGNVVRSYGDLGDMVKAGTTAETTLSRFGISVDELKQLLPLL